MTQTDATSAPGIDLSRIRHDGAREALAKAIDELTTSEGWLRWLESRARFHSYSLNNTLMILTQRPDATQVAGYRAWQSMGRQVRKGERGIAILAPMVCKVTDDEGTEGKRVVGFRGVYVFDVSQTDGEPLAEPPCRRLEGDDEAAHQLNRGLLDVIAGEGLDLEFEDLGAMGANGYYQRERGRIVLDLDMAAAQQAKTMAHELAHHFDPEAPTGMEYVLHRGEAETVAEAAAYVVCRSAGLDTSAYSVGYVATWAKGDAGMVYQLAQRIDAAANSILAGLDAANATADEVTPQLVEAVA